MIKLLFLYFGANRDCPRCNKANLIIVLNYPLSENVVDIDRCKIKIDLIHS